MVNGAMQVGVALGPTIVGVLRDRWGGYEGALYVLVAIEATVGAHRNGLEATLVQRGGSM